MTKKNTLSIMAEKDAIDAAIAAKAFSEEDIRECNVPDEECECEVKTEWSGSQICTFCFDLSQTGIEGWEDNPVMQRPGFIVWGSVGSYSVATGEDGESFGILTTPRFIDPKNVIEWHKVEVC